MSQLKSMHEVFEECLELVFGGESVEECLRRYPDQAKELRPLIETAVATRKVMAAATPTAQFREKARQELYAAQRDLAATRAGRRRWLSWEWRPAWAVSLGVAVLVIMAGSGAVLASTGSMPGQPLYAVKHTAQSARIALTRSPQARSELYATLADQRVQEIVYLAGTGTPERMEQPTRDLDTYLNRISELNGGLKPNAVAAARNASSAGGTAESTAGDNPPQLAAPASPAPQTAPGTPFKMGATDSSNTTLAASATAPTPTIAIGIPPAVAFQKSDSNPGEVVVSSAAASDPKARLRARIILQSSKDQAKLEAALESAPPQARPALLQAIAISQSGYEKALQSLETE
jgi:hypothetical protein